MRKLLRLRIQSCSQGAMMHTTKQYKYTAPGLSPLRSFNIKPQAFYHHRFLTTTTSLPSRTVPDEKPQTDVCPKYLLDRDGPAHRFTCSQPRKSSSEGVFEKRSSRWVAPFETCRYGHSRLSRRCAVLNTTLLGTHRLREHFPSMMVRTADKDGSDMATSIGITSTERTIIAAMSLLATTLATTSVASQPDEETLPIRVVQIASRAQGDNTRPRMAQSIPAPGQVD